MIEAVARPKAGRTTHCVAEQYEELYRRSVETPDAFWLEQAERLDWFEAPSKGGEWSFDPVDIRWFDDGVLNLCHNAVDRHLRHEGAIRPSSSNPMIRQHRCASSPTASFTTK